MVTRPTLKPLAFVLIVLLLGALAAGNYLMLQQAPFGPCGTAEGSGLIGVDLFSAGLSLACRNYVYYFLGAPLAVGLLLLVIVPRLVTVTAPAEEAKETQPVSKTVETKKPTPPPPTKPTSDAAVQLLALFQREGRLVDFLREDIAPYEDAQIGAAVRTIHQACRQVLDEHLTLEPVLSGNEGDEVTVAKDFDPSAFRLTGNINGEPPFRGALRHPGWRATRVRLPDQPRGQDPKIVAPAEVEIP